MALTITELCANCSLCEVECPNGAISQGEDRFVIDPEKCTECVGDHDAPKCVEICPVDSIEQHPYHVESREQLVAKREKQRKHN